MNNANVGEWMAMGILKRMVSALREIGISGLLARLIVTFNGWTPLIITLKKGDQSS